MSVIIDTVQPYIEEVVQDLQCELVDLEYVKEGKNWFLRVYIDQEGGIDLDQCVLASEQISQVLDGIQPDPFPQAYYLEVSSPGAERPLKTAAQIEAAIGQYVHFDYYAPQHGQKHHEGVLLGVEDEVYRIEVQVKTRKQELAIDKSAVSHARLEVKF